MQKWEMQLPEEVQAVVVPPKGKEDPTVFQEKGPFAGFPYYRSGAQCIFNFSSSNLHLLKSCQALDSDLAAQGTGTLCNDTHLPDAVLSVNRQTFALNPCTSFLSSCQETSIRMQFY